MEKQGIYIRELTVTDIDALLSYEIKNRDFLKDTIPLKADIYYTLAGQQQRLENILTCKMNDLGYSYGVFLKKDHTLIGTIDLFQVERGPLQSAWLGYALDKDYQGYGYTTQGVREVIEIGFNDLQLHRIEAGAMPRNEASIRVLEKTGFQKEGLSLKNVQINGKWEDHYLFAILNPNSNI
ncbi:ribosomal-protein-alanine N-acetyltransferase [Breznakia sp. PF5-3]|uniref:GNAT family N-acetyltransferase n=1 Tax=unclassified Breznakia TaxID=2623764 RepID=UPI00240652F6|nr:MULTISPECIES: GNAT family protein [unclassified Breznakia]MDL2276608.1 GNAT family N-acetyltransferase [Breznakia sp. OttesenSCG-928-G09]MDF9824652.1 ribosomal-protein-alanine N-acetyltransferase [Breznakia sp. PM6-1]MDF9835637.1 ribosomal-protein-alanine N-acetyltransferase [Breznakia sp. PF5-3]MDF9837698.1 ribosomal-protein-alanine N-acetyltransferase [Breznakia sp. PFB2-8]MDF9859562.1 ribosomal-protein-alanine N-acetyltransferase [Breznakia sp. PH5-24]